MVAWFLTAILTVGLFAYISLTGVSIVSNTQNGAQRSEAVRRLDMVVQGLQSQSAAPLADGVVYAPAGTFRNGLYGLPSNLLPVGVTSFGSKFVYCPMGRPLDTANDNVTFNGGSYGVRTVELNDMNYVVTGRAATTAASDPNVIAFVIAPASGEGTMPGCNDVVRNGDVYTAPNAIVRVLRRTAVTDVDAVRMNSGNIWYVSPEGRGNGQSPGTPASLSSALAAYRGSLGDTFTVVLSGGTYASQESPLDQTVTSIAAKKESSTLVLTSPTAATIRVAGLISVPGNLEVKNIDLTGTAILAESGRYFRSTGSSLGPVVAKSRSRVIFSGSNVVRSTPGIAAALNQLAGSTVSVSAGTLTIQYNNAVPAWRIEAGAGGTASATTINVQPADGSASQNVQFQLISTDPGSQLVLKSSVLNFNGQSTYPVLIGGRMTAYTTTFNSNAPTYVGIQGTASARLDLPDVTVRGTSPPTYSLSAVGTGAITGYGNLYSQGRCWYRQEGSLFRSSPVGYAGENSAVTPDDPLPPLDAQPTGVQVQRYQFVVARNTDKAALRSVLSPQTAPFSCQQSGAASYSSLPNVATENTYLNVPYYTTVRYGANGAYKYRYVGEEGIMCDNATFGDPIVGTVKQCQYLIQ